MWYADGPRPGSVSTWAMLIQRVYEVDSLECSCCGGQMKTVSFIVQLLKLSSCAVAKLWVSLLFLAVA